MPSQSDKKYRPRVGLWGFGTVKRTEVSSTATGTVPLFEFIKKPIDKRAMNKCVNLRVRKPLRDDYEQLMRNQIYKRDRINAFGTPRWNQDLSRVERFPTDWMQQLTLELHNLVWQTAYNPQSLLEGTEGHPIVLDKATPVPTLREYAMRAIPGLRRYLFNDDGTLRQHVLEPQISIFPAGAGSSTDWWADYVPDFPLYSSPSDSSD